MLLSSEEPKCTTRQQTLLKRFFHDTKDGLTFDEDSNALFGSIELSALATEAFFKTSIDRNIVYTILPAVVEEISNLETLDRDLNGRLSIIVLKSKTLS
jgi:hypothetical protein